MEKIHNKLVRDNIPDIIKNNNEIPHTRLLDDNEYKKELFQKLIEESNEVIHSKSKDEIIEELSDVLEVIRAIAEFNGENLDKVIEKAEIKKLKRGGFSKRIYLERTISNEVER